MILSASCPSFIYDAILISFAPVGALKTATKQFLSSGVWVGADTHYYRYYKVGEMNGFAYALKYIVEPADYQRLAAVADPFTASNATVAQYATKYYEYNDQRRVVREKVYGGTESYQFSFSTGSLSKNVNSWTQKTTETYADGSIKTVYTNHDGQILLTEEAASSSYYAEKVINHYVYDAQDNQIQHNTPEVISSYTLYGGYNSTVTAYLNAKGLIHKKQYYNNVSGQPNGYLYTHRTLKIG